MFTVLRVTGKQNDLLKFGRKINSIRSKTFNGVAKRGGHFSSVVCSSDEWIHHLAAIGDLVAVFEIGLREVAPCPLLLTLDVACESTDYANRFLTEITLGADTLQLLVSQRISLSISIYGTGEV